MAQTKVNLAKLFGNVAQELAKNQSTLNQADTQNNDHGSTWLMYLIPSRRPCRKTQSLALLATGICQRTGSRKLPEWQRHSLC